MAHNPSKQKKTGGKTFSPHWPHWGKMLLLLLLPAGFFCRTADCA
jgi:hypothetical protein